MLRMLLALLVFIASSPAIAESSIADRAKQISSGDWGAGNGGDGVRIEGKLVLRDFLGKMKLIPNNKSFLEQTPDFIPLLMEIAQVLPELSLEIWHDLNRAKIWTTEEELNPLNPSQTGLTKTVEIEQIAYRDTVDYGKHGDLIISIPKFQESERQYVLMHESFHALLGRSGPLHHMRVREAVRYLKENRGKYDRAQMLAFLDQLNFSPESVLGSERHSTKLFKMTDLVRMLLLEEGSFEARCSLIKLVEKSASYSVIDIIRFKSSMEKWANYSTCPPGIGTEKFAKLYPELAAYRSFEGTRSTYAISESIKNDGSRSLRKLYLEQCSKYASEDEGQRNKRQLEVFQAAKASLDRLAQENYAPTSDPAENLYIAYIIDQNTAMSGARFEWGGLNWSSIDERVKEAQESMKNFQENRRHCSIPLKRWWQF